VAIVVAGSTPPLHIYAWNLQTGKLIDIQAMRTWVRSLTLVNRGMLVSAFGWKRRFWDLYKECSKSESLQHTTDVSSGSRPDGKEVCCGTTEASL
jgi:hypothetical protein